MTDNPFAPDVIEAVAHHMNVDHAHDSLLIVRQLGGASDAAAAEVTHLDGTGVDFTVTTETGGTRDLRIPWSRPLTERPEIRREFVRLHEEATLASGGEPSPAVEH